MNRAGAVAVAIALALPTLAGPATATDAPAVPLAHAHAPVADTSTDEAAASSTGAPDPAQPSITGTAPSDPDAAATRSGLEIYDAFRQGLADPECHDSGNDRWLRHFAHAPARLADPDSDVLPLFGHVVDSLRQAHLPTEFALIPFVESGYAPAARAKAGPAGLWQLVSITARHHGLRVNEGYDARLSPAASTRAAVRYLKTLNGIFGGNWRLAAMAYNTGEYRLLHALRRSGTTAVEATPADLPGVPAITRAYVDKLHALACVLQRAGDNGQWRAALDRPVPRLHAQHLEGSARLAAWARRNAHDPAQLERLNPALANGRWPRGAPPLALVPARTADAAAASSAAAGITPTAVTASPASADAPARSHVVRRGESPWSIARRHGMRLDRLLERNGLGPQSILRPGMVLQID
ncbi:transglycosylase SLT domain-containing protein [Pseudoxanthomonas koreensis]|uniref:lytic transglycosylase domain-containing protein n=1 Tax=Pseudoxanthomonas koreensis TaxID=266061 RepID=UPI0035A6D509